jgi:membrane dipeptidase
MSSMLGSSSRRGFLHGCAAAFVVGRARPAPFRGAASWSRYNDIVVIDAQGFLLGRGVSLARALDDAKASGLSAVNITLGTADREGVFEKTIADIGEWEARLAAHPDRLLKIRSANDIESARASKRLGIIYGFQDPGVLEGKIDRLRLLNDFGVRVIQLTYNRRSELGDGCLEPEDRGLTPFGRTVVERMNELGMLVDLSHCGRRTTTEAIAASKRPVSITHAGCAAVADTPRNKTDAALKSLADRGGVVGIYFMPFLRTKGNATAGDVIQHVEHALNVCGEDHVGIGTDGRISAMELTAEYRQRLREEVQRRRALGVSSPGEEADDVLPLVEELNDVRRLEKLAELLLARRHSAARVEKILGANFLRLMRDVWGPNQA